MSQAVTNPRRWPPRRWWTAVILVLGLQLALIFWLGERPPPTPRVAIASPAILLPATAPAEMLALTDPTLFALPHKNGFSGAAWMTMPPQEFLPYTWSEPPSWLPLPAEQLGASFRDFIATNKFEAAFSPTQPDPEPLRPELTVNPLVPDHSTLRLSGVLAARPLLRALDLPQWTNAFPLRNTVVRVVVRPDGRVFSPFWVSKSGSTAADQSALEATRTLRFAPVTNGGGQTPGNPFGPMTWGEVVFEWHTVSPPPTNALVMKP